MEAVTYSLKPGQSNSNAYYNDVHTFTDIVLSHTQDSLMPIANEYYDFLNTYKLEELREIEEYILELISFGVLWRSYAGTALAVKHAPFITLARMAEWRKKHQRIKPYIDFARGILMTGFLLPDSKNKRPDIPTLRQIDHVCKWFEATGEFREQAYRFIRWRGFWETKSPGELLKIFTAIEDFTQWFEESSIEALGKYTQNVDNFINSNYKRYLWREDRISCTRKRIEYHLNMVGADLMNRAFRTEYLDTEIKNVLVPGCMRTHVDKKCKAKKVKEGLICDGCEPQCRINRLGEMGRKNNFDVYIIPHASDLSLWTPKTNQPKRGVVASACVTTLVEGGWELKRYDVPAQCVLLDYSGCKKHWRKDGFATELNVLELKKKIFDEKV
ncbi:MAG: DUF116 domain-containing protein [Ignavibacteriae bacterium]|nr:MAG: DUF116 domain-containing protein [Ignavibacteriota bacterium]